jgi:serine/threonine-protein kinase RsbW
MEPSKKHSLASEGAHVVEVTAASDHLDAVHETLGRFWPGLSEPPDDRWRLLFEVAVSEIAANIVEHAQPAVMTFRLTAISRRVVAEFQDSGTGWTGYPGPAAVLDELAERGRGLAMARTAVDEVAYRRVGTVNYWKLAKQL